MRRLAWMFAMATLGAAAACNNGTEPRKTFNICVHAQGAPFTPGSTGDECTKPQAVRPGQTVTIDVEADKLTGENRTADLAIEFAPNGWTVTLGGSTIAVPGKQSLTIVAPSAANAGSYQIAIRGTSGGEQVISVFRVVVNLF